MTGGPIILFDAVCNLCNGAVQFIIRNDKHKVFKFASLQSEEAQQLLQNYLGKVPELKTMILIEDGKTYTRSTAALRIARRLRWPFPVLYGFLIVPRFIRDALYQLISKYRYQWFGKKDHCMVPTEDLRARFLNFRP